MKTYVNKVVTVYRDPLTREHPEGDAVLLKRIKERNPEVKPETERWTVRFIGDSRIVERTIRVDVNEIAEDREKKGGRP